MPFFPLDQLPQFYDKDDHLPWYEVFTAVHFAETAGEHASQEDLGGRFGLSRDQVRYALEMAQKRFTYLLRREVCDQVGSEGEVGEEIRELLALLEK